MSVLFFLLKLVCLPWLLVGFVLFCLLLRWLVRAYDRRRSREISGEMERIIRRATSDDRG